MKNPTQSALARVIVLTRRSRKRDPRQRFEKTGLVLSLALTASLLGWGIGCLNASCSTPLLRSSSFLRAEGDGTVADLNGDGRLDVAFCSATQIKTFLGNGHGTFIKGPTSPGYEVMGLAAGDFNKDGKIDLVGTSNPTNSLVFFRALGGGSFSAPVSTKIPQSGVRGLAVADFNADGKLDVASANEWSGTVSVMAGNGQGGFTPISHTPVGSQPQYLIGGDLNADRKPDLIVSGVSSYVLIGDGKGAFPKISSVFSGGANVSAVAAADFDGDGKPDLAVSSSLSRLISWIPGDGQGNFGAPIVLRNGRDSASIAAADFNSDGKADIITTEGILLSDGNGEFHDVPALPRNDLGGDLIIADFSEDHILDLMLLADGGFLLLGDGKGGIANNTGRIGLRIATGDVNEDGYEDVIKTANGISVFLGHGTGIFADPQRLEIGPYVYDVKLNDFNNDGHLDIAALDTNAPAHIMLLLGNGHGQFVQAGSVSPGGMTPWSMNSADFDGDGNMDVATCAQQLDVVVSYGDGKGGLSDPVTIPMWLGSNPFRFVADDLNRDGKADLAVLDERGGISILFSQARTFADPVQLATDVAGNAVSAGDLDGDDDLDLVTATTTAEGQDRVAVFLGDGSGHFSAPSFYPAPLYPSDLIIFDVNNDGCLDVAVSGVGSIAVMLGDGLGKLNPPSYLDSAKTDQVCLAAADVDGNGSSDLLVDGFMSFFSVMLNDCQAGSHFYFPQVAAGRSDPVSIQTELDLINTGLEADVTVDFTDDQGQPMALSFNGQPASAHSAVRLRSGQHWSVLSSSDGPLKVGYAEVRSEGKIGGTAVYRYRENDEVLYEAGVAAVAKPSRNLTFYARSRSGQASAIALLNSSTEPATATLRLYGPDAQLLATRSTTDVLGGRPMAAKEHFARFISELFPATSFDTGTVTAETDQPLSAVSLQLFSGPPEPASPLTRSLTVLPVSLARADHASTSMRYEQWYFPQIADGFQGNLTLTTRFLLFNAGANSAVRVEFFNSDGAPMQVELADQGRASRFDFSLQRGQTWLGETKAATPLQTGYAIVTACGSVSSSATFISKQDGFVTGETSVPGVKSRTNYWLMVPENNATRMAGIALVNQGLLPATVRLALYDKTLEKVGEKQLFIGAAGKTAQFASELFTGVTADQFNQATIRVESDQPLAGAMLLQSHHPSLSFPGGRYLLTLLPVEPE